MQLDALVDEAGLATAGELIGRHGPQSVEIRALTMDSRSVRPGVLFACVPGRSRDGHDFAAAAVAEGAVALVVQRLLDIAVPQVVVRSVRASLGPLADAFHGHPSRQMVVVGVTGTNGKTTTCALLEGIFAQHGWRSAALGTLTGSRTTPEAPDLQATLAELRDRGTDAVAMEVSSHALDQRRVDATHFAAAVLTNVTQDHLDYHLSMEAYFEAKARLFAPDRTDIAVVNADDPWGSRLLDRLGAGGSASRPWSMADVSELRMTPEGSQFVWSGQSVALALPGRFNVANAIAAAVCALAIGIDPATIAEGLGSVTQVRGRFQPVDAGQAFTVLVDYAHTPDGLRQALLAGRELCSGRLLVVFGAGGDRDKAKRPLMGAVAGRLADLAIVTSDNPRHEDPRAIIDAIVSGAPEGAHLVIEEDRGAAIATALAAAGPDDVVVIAGKGHETGQQIGERTQDFDDLEVAQSALIRILASRRPRGDGQ
ncbi:MAG: UDP-N-acetylmuramoyl-L-alanyl-D-glutamate--2,6-diaminopimelate ligase [Actinomycetota bacterium]|nr:UDP-N-acetylmuramoyl-L-alanyl-D-glutamate--2,6-diaminopimelate ligase [Actinomycetota bacterium]